MLSKILFSFTLLSCLLRFSYADTTVDDFLNEEEELLHLQTDFSIIDEITDQESAIDIPPEETKTVEKIREVESPIKYKALLKNHSLLIKIINQEKFKNSRKIYVRAREIYFGGKYSYLYNDDDQIIYKTLTKNLIPIGNVTNLFPLTNPPKDNPVKTNYHTTDKSFPINNHFIFKQDTATLDYQASILDLDDKEAVSTTFSYKGFYESFLPLDIGMGLDLQSGKFSNSTKKTTFLAIFLGPIVKYDFFERKDFKLDIQMSIKKSTSHSVKSTEASYSFSSTLWSLGTEAVVKTTIGNFSIGAEYSSMRSSLKGDISSGTFSTTKKSMPMTAFTLGYQFYL